MNVVGHQAVTEEMPTLALDNRRKQAQIEEPVLLINKYPPAVNPASNDVIGRTGNFMSKS
jgi:hypothetical protein